ncbi:MAG: hypothetical protein BWZ00_01062 [Bacteroidetes bacterium ADurb.BinA174]|nr:MAG: hypothetical protein BWZ00_01062 [Bacteroidetes bacterium ADurb.BinA174]
MKIKFFPFFLIAFIILSCGNDNIISSPKNADLQLKFYTPADIWEKTFPLGNGRIGMMPDGGVATDHIVLNDITMWSGSEEDALNPDAVNYLPQIRQLLLEGKNVEAQNIMYEHFNCKGKGSGHGNGKDVPYGCFQMLADLFIHQTFPTTDTEKDYTRILSLSDAVATTTFSKGDLQITREYLASHSDNILAIRISANKKKSVSFALEMSRPERAEISVKDNVLVMEGQLNDGYNGTNGVKFLTKVKIVNKGGKVTPEDKKISLQDADEALILVSSSTDMLDKNYTATVDNLLSKAEKLSFATLKEQHIQQYQEKFNRVELNLGEQNTVDATDKRLNDFQQNDDPAFAALYFQFGRYLMICGTNEETLPLNLQGLWANTVQTPWNGDYHLNINVQMNYWPTEVCNLSELHKPLIEFTKSLVPSGTATAKTYYGAEGWTAHMMSNPWKFTAPGEHASWGATVTGGAWLCEHLWEHYAFTQDKEYLASVYPTLKGAADFFLSTLIEEPLYGWLVTAPSSSPENGFRQSGNKQTAFVCMGPTMDTQIMTELFNNVLSASQILGVEDKTVTKIKETLPKLPPMQISEKGYLMEWLQDYEEVEPRHRHVSHLYGLYPANQISPNTTPELAAAARETLERRGDGGTGWSRAWKVNFWARLHDGNRAYKLLKSLLQPSVNMNAATYNGHGGGTYPNLFCAHPPFQIDGNFGGTSGIAEMLIQSQNDYIDLLPALPDTWHTGSLKGFRVRGGAEIDIKWIDKKIETFSVKSDVSNTFKVKVPQNTTSFMLKSRELPITDGFVSLDLKAGEKVIIDIR